MGLAGDEGTAQAEKPRQGDPLHMKDRVIRLLSSKLKDLTAQATAQVTAQVVLFCMEPRGAREIMSMLGLKHWKTFQSNYLKPLLESDWIEMTIPDKPTSPKQKYRTGDKGKALFAELEEAEQ